MPASASFLRAAGLGGISPLAASFLAAAGAGLAAAAGAGAGLAAGFSAALAAAAAPPLLMAPSSGADGDRLPLHELDLAQHARCRGRDLDRHLVGLELDQRLVGLDGITGILEPLADDRLGNALAQGRHANFGRHLRSHFPAKFTVASRHLPAPQLLLPPVSAASTSVFCSYRCFDNCPVAVEAEAGRPA